MKAFREDPGAYNIINDSAALSREYVQNPSYYERLEIQPDEYIVKNRLGFREGNIVKYVSRYQFKGGLADLYKAQSYLEKLIKEEEGKR